MIEAVFYLRFNKVRWAHTWDFSSQDVEGSSILTLFMAFSVFYQLETYKNSA